jgi:hypothetical protein
MNLLSQPPEAVSAHLHVYMTEEGWVIAPLKIPSGGEAAQWVETLPITCIDRGELVLLSEALSVARHASADHSGVRPWDNRALVNDSRRLFSVRWYEAAVAALVVYRPSTTGNGLSWVRVLSREWNNASELQIARHLIEQSAWVGPKPPFGVPHRPQRRAHFRLPLHMPLHFCPIRSLAAYEANLTDWPDSVSERLHDQGQPGQVEDLSAGGLRMRVTEPLNPGDAVYLEMILWNHPFRTAAQVRRSQPSGEYDWQVGVQFVGMESQAKDQVVHFLFDEQHRRPSRLV